MDAGLNFGVGISINDEHHVYPVKSLEYDQLYEGWARTFSGEDVTVMHRKHVAIRGVGRSPSLEPGRDYAVTVWIGSREDRHLEPMRLQKSEHNVDGSWQFTFAWETML